MPSLIRFLIVLLFLAGIAYGGMIAMVAMVEPNQREVTVRIPTTTLFGDEQNVVPARPGLPVPGGGAAPATTPSEPEATQ